MPKAARDELGLDPGTELEVRVVDRGIELEVRVVDRGIEIEVPVTEMRLEADEHGVVAVVDREMPVLTAEMDRETLERVGR